MVISERFELLLTSILVVIVWLIPALLLVIFPLLNDMSDDLSALVITGAVNVLLVSVWAASNWTILLDEISVNSVAEPAAISSS